MKQASPKYPIIFTHVPRSAGTTLVNILGRHFKANEQFFFYVTEKGGNVDSALEEFKDMSVNEKRRLKLLQGHTSFGIHESYPSYTYITLSRDPAERIISYYYYILSNSHHYLHSLVVNAAMTLDEFITCELSVELDNIMTRQISGNKDVKMGRCSHQMLQTAKLNLIKSYAIAGITERFDETLILMKQYFNWPFPFYIKLNIIPNKPMKREVPDDTLRLIEKYNSLDMQLYNFANQHFDNLIEQQGEQFQIDLKTFQKYNALLQKHSGNPIGKAGSWVWEQYTKLFHGS
jgi:hypothetical protein